MSITTNNTSSLSTEMAAPPEQLPPPHLSENHGNAAGSESRDQDNEGASKKDRKRKVPNNGVAVRRSNRRQTQLKGSRNNCTAITTGEKLDSGTFLRYLVHVWDAFPEEKLKSFTYLDPLWFCMYAEGNENRKATVLDWIKKKDLFSNKYVFVPIVMGSHWSLLIICNLGENAPGMLLLDSLQATGSTELKRLIIRFLIGIYKSEERTESEKQIWKMPFLIPKVPQQKNGEKCGFYVLYYMRLFIERAPESVNVSEGHPVFMNKDWFTDEAVEAFSKSLVDLPVAVSDRDGDPVSNDSSDSVEVSMTPFPDDSSRNFER